MMLTIAEIEFLREEFAEQRPVYEALAQRVRGLLDDETRQNGIPCLLQHRAKDIDSYVKKAIQKEYPNPSQDIHDKAAVRVIVSYSSDVPKVESIISQQLVILQRQNKAEELDYNKFDYVGIHFEVSLPLQEPLPDGDGEFKDKICEIQVHTRAQAMWAEISHNFLYKPTNPPSQNTRRLIHRLAALVELFDDQVRSVQNSLQDDPTFALLGFLETTFYQVSARQSFDRALSVDIIQALVPTRYSDDLKGIEDFVAKYKQKLLEIYRRYQDDTRSTPLLFQPESVLVFEMLERDRYLLKQLWNESFSFELLQALAVIWGSPY